MKILAILIMFVALFLLYRIAYPKQADTTKDGEIPPEKKQKSSDVMGKSRFVLPDRSKPLQTPATSPETEKPDEKADIFAAETERKPSGIIPENELDEAFGNKPNPEILSLPLESETDDEINYEAEEEAEELNRTLGHEAIYAEGIGYDDLRKVVKVVTDQPDTVSEETGRKIVALEHTDMFEMLVSGNEGKMNWIKSVVERHVRNTMPQTENEISGTDYDYGGFCAADYLD